MIVSLIVLSKDDYDILIYNKIVFINFLLKKWCIVFCIGEGGW